MVHKLDDVDAIILMGDFGYCCDNDISLAMNEVKMGNWVNLYAFDQLKKEMENEPRLGMILSCALSCVFYFLNLCITCIRSFDYMQS